MIPNTKFIIKQKLVEHGPLFLIMKLFLETDWEYNILIPCLKSDN